MDLQLSLAEYLRTGDDFIAQGYVKTLAILRAGLADAAKGDGRDLQVDRLKEAASLLDKWDADVAQPLLAAKKRLVDLRAGSLPDVSRGEKTIRDLKELLSEYITDTGEDLKAQRAQENAARAEAEMASLKSEMQQSLDREREGLMEKLPTQEDSEALLAMSALLMKKVTLTQQKQLPQMRLAEAA